MLVDGFVHASWRQKASKRDFGRKLEKYRTSRNLLFVTGMCIVMDVYLLDQSTSSCSYSWKSSSQSFLAIRELWCGL